MQLLIEEQEDEGWVYHSRQLPVISHLLQFLGQLRHLKESDTVFEGQDDTQREFWSKI